MTTVFIVFLQFFNVFINISYLHLINIFNQVVFSHISLSGINI